MNNLKKLQKTLPTLPEERASLDTLVPTTVEDYGILVGVGNGHPHEYKHLLVDTAELLGLLGIDTVSEDAVESASHRWTSTVDPWVAVGTRVEALHRAYRQDESVVSAAERLWAALEFRCKAITGQTLSEVLA